MLTHRKGAFRSLRASRLAVLTAALSACRGKSVDIRHCCAPPTVAGQK